MARTFDLAAIFAMLEVCAPEFVPRSTDHHIVVHRGKRKMAFRKGKGHPRDLKPGTLRKILEKGATVRKAVRALDLDEKCVEEQLGPLS